MKAAALRSPSICAPAHKAERSARPAPPVEAAYEAVQTPGHPLDHAASRVLGSRFGYDFGGVRVHTGPDASRAAQSVNAHAYTLGQHIVFNRGEYQPRTARGIELIAHELAHTVQQRGAAAAAPGAPSDPAMERNATAAAGSALRGERASVQSAARQTLQRAEFGTYVSRVGMPEYLDAGAHFYQTWGYPNVQRVNNLQDVLKDLDKSPGNIDKFRIVSHGLGGPALEIGLIPEFVTTPDPTVSKNELEFTTEQRFRNELAAGPNILSASAYGTLVGVLQKDATTKPFLDTLGAGSTTPGVTSALGILLKAMLETYYLASVELDTGGKPKFANRGILDTYNQSRVTAYRAAVIANAPASDKAKVGNAISQLNAEIPDAFQRANWNFGTFTKDEAKSFADPFLDTTSKSPKLSPLLQAQIREGAGGPFLKTLRSVRKKITSSTHIEIRGCNVGTSLPFLNQVRAFFGEPGNLPSLSAPDLFQYYFRLNFTTVPKNKASEADLLQKFDDAGTGLAQGYLNSELVRAKKVAIVVDEPKMDAISQKYGVAVAELKKLNPKVDPAKLSPGQMVWLTAPKTKVVSTGPFTTLSDFCEKNLGNLYIWPAVWSLNPSITDPSKLQPNTPITIPETSPAFTELLANLRSGKTAMAVSSDNKPVLYMDDAKRADALGQWLSQQKWDPQGRTASALSALYTKNFSGAAGRTFIEFLSRGYPQIVDPIFPDDPRYAGHIKRQP